MNLEVDRRRLEEHRDTLDETQGFHVAGSRTGLSFSGAPERRRNPYSGTWAYRTAKDGETASGSLVERALAHLRHYATDLDEISPEPVDFIADPRVISGRGGERTVHLQQHVHGVPIFRAVRSVRFNSRSEIVDVVGDHVPVRRGDVNLLPTLGAEDAVLAATKHLAAPGGDRAVGIPDFKVSNRRPHVTAALNLPASPTLVWKAPFKAPITTHLILFFERPNLLLGWFVPLFLDKPVFQYDLIIAANGVDAGEILFCRNGIASTNGITARATRFNPGLDPLRLLDMPQPLDAYPPLRPSMLLPTGFPLPWVEGNTTDGNNVVASRSGKVVKATKQGNVSEFGGMAGSDAEKVVNAFFLCNYLHDFFYLLGFDEASGSFQKKNLQGVGLGNDAVEVRIFGGSFDGDARFQIQRDGEKALLDLGSIGSRHTALDADVMIHEYTHGVTSRLIGSRGEWKPLINGPAQSRAIDEGTSDYFALTLQNYLRRREGLPENFVYGSWSSSNPVNGRRLSSYAVFSNSFSSLENSPFDKPHNGGMIWCATLLAMNRKLGDALSSLERGDEIGWLLVLEAMRKIPIGQDAPSFLDGRDALLRAVDTLGIDIPKLADGSGLFNIADLANIESSIREAFAQFGMGRSARSQGGALVGIVNDFNP